MAKRSRELARQQKREEKLERQESRNEATIKLAPDDEAILLEEFARLNEEFAAEQATTVEFMAYVVRAERPARENEIATVMAAHRQQRVLASNVFEQIESAEAAMVALWVERFGVLEE